LVHINIRSSLQRKIKKCEIYRKTIKIQNMEKQVIENFEEWIFEAAAPKKPAAPVIPAGYVKSTLPVASINTLVGSTNDEVEKAKGWKALKDTNSLQLSGEFAGSGIISDKVGDFNKIVGGVRVTSPSIYGREEKFASFIVGFPYSRTGGIESSNIILSEKYVLFTPWQNGEANIFKGSVSGAASRQPADFRLIAVDKLPQIGMQSLMWILGLNNSTTAKKRFSTYSKLDVISTLKEGLTDLSKSSNIANANKSGKIIFDGYKALVSSPDAHLLIFNNFVDGNPDIRNVDYLKKNLPLKTV